MITLGDIVLNILVYMNMYYYIAPIIFVPGIYYIAMKMLFFPLISRKTHEFIIIAKPESVVIKKIAHRYHPMFSWKNGMYWFSKPCHDVENTNQYQVFMEGLNQSVTSMERLQNKCSDLMRNKTKVKQLSGHQIRIPRNLKGHLHRHYVLILDPINDLAQLKPVDEKQSFRVNFTHTLGIFVQENNTIETEQPNETNENATQIVQTVALTTQSVMQQIAYVQENSNFSSHYAYTLWKTIRNVDRNFMTWVKGSLDPKVIAIFLMLAGGIAAIYLVMHLMNPQTALGPMPT